MKEIIEELSERIKTMEADKEDMNEGSWGYEKGIIITGNEAKKIIELYNSIGKLQINDIIILYNKWLEEHHNRFVISCSFPDFLKQQIK